MRILALLAIAILPVMLFQNCTPSHFASGVDATISSSAPSPQGGSGNGDGYGGKLTLYEYSDPSYACELARDGNPLPSHALLVGKSSDSVVAFVALVRENCVDIAPRNLQASAFTVVNASQIQSGARVFSAFQPVDFQLIASACPAGRAEIPGAARMNGFVSPFDLTANIWGSIGGMGVALTGSMGSLPANRVSRTVDASTGSDQSIRLDQPLTLKKNTSYVMSFLVGAASSSRVRYEMWGGTGYGGLFEWDLATGQLVTSNVYSGLSAIASPAPRRFGNSWFLTLYFTTGASVTGIDVGFAPSTFAVGDFIDITSPQIEEVNSFCAP